MLHYELPASFDGECRAARHLGERQDWRDSSYTLHLAVTVGYLADAQPGNLVAPHSSRDRRADVHARDAPPHTCQCKRRAVNPVTATRAPSTAHHLVRAPTGAASSATSPTSARWGLTSRHASAAGTPLHATQRTKPSWTGLTRSGTPRTRLSRPRRRNKSGSPTHGRSALALRVPARTVLTSKEHECPGASSWRPLRAREWPCLGVHARGELTMIGSATTCVAAARSLRFMREVSTCPPCHRAHESSDAAGVPAVPALPVLRRPPPRAGARGTPVGVAPTRGPPTGVPATGVADAAAPADAPPPAPTAAAAAAEDSFAAARAASSSSMSLAFISRRVGLRRSIVAESACAGAAVLAQCPQAQRVIRVDHTPLSSCVYGAAMDTTLTTAAPSSNLGPVCVARAVSVPGLTLSLAHIPPPRGPGGTRSSHTIGPTPSTTRRPSCPAHTCS